MRDERMSYGMVRKEFSVLKPGDRVEFRTRQVLQCFANYMDVGEFELDGIPMQTYVGTIVGISDLTTPPFHRIAYSIRTEEPVAGLFCGPIFPEDIVSRIIAPSGPSMP